MSASFTIRDAAPGDADAIHRFLRALAEETGDAARFRSTPETVRRDGFGLAPLFRTQLAEDRAVPVGLALYLPYYSTTLAAPGLYVQDLYIAPAARGTGLGRRLLAAAARDAGTAWGARFVRLAVFASNDGAIGFYRRLGFSIDDHDTPAMLVGAAHAALLEVT